MTKVVWEDGLGTTARSTCQRCGVVFEFPSRYLYGRNFNAELCADCKAQPQKTITKDGMTCKPWPGDFDLDLNVCLKDGKPHLVGPRSCGKADCIAPSHIQTAWLAGRQITFEEFMKITEQRKGTK
jgi:hypothetical protein